MIDEDIRKDILNRLRSAEKEHNVRVLFAIESGSRAWGFASPNSDYDVRFIYAQEPQWYQAVDLEERRDVIEYPIVDEIDINGWDVRKALRLFWKSNPAFVEWIQSPIVYLEQSCLRPEALEILTKIYSPEKGIYHYRSMAKTNYRGYLRKEMVPLKKYFYVLRPLLAARWIHKYNKAAPIEFETLLGMLEYTEKQVFTEIQVLLDKKRVTPELGLSPAVQVLNTFIENELGTDPEHVPKKSYLPQITDGLNKLFHSVLAEHGANNALQPTPKSGAAEL